MGYDGLFFARNDYDDRNKRLADKTMEMVWRPSKSLGKASELFTGVLYYGYGPPPGLCFDIHCSDEPVQVILSLSSHTHISHSHFHSHILTPHMSYTGTLSLASHPHTDTPSHASHPHTGTPLHASHPHTGTPSHASHPHRMTPT